MTTGTFQNKKLLFVVLRLYIIHHLCKASTRDAGLQVPEEDANRRNQVLAHPLHRILPQCLTILRMQTCIHVATRRNVPRYEDSQVVFLRHTSQQTTHSFHGAAVAVIKYLGEMHNPEANEVLSCTCSEHGQRPNASLCPLTNTRV